MVCRAAIRCTISILRIWSLWLGLHTTEQYSRFDLTILNLNSFLVKRQIDNPSPGAVTGGNHSLALTSEVNSDTQSSDSSEEEIKRLGEVIPVPGSLGEEAMLKDIFTCLSNIYS